MAASVVAPATTPNRAQWRICEATTPGPSAARRARQPKSAVWSSRVTPTPKSTAPASRGGEPASQRASAYSPSATTAPPTTTGVPSRKPSPHSASATTPSVSTEVAGAISSG